MFYCRFIESILAFCGTFLVWIPYLKKQEKRLGNIVRLCSKMAGINLEELALLYRVRATRAAHAILLPHSLLYANYKLM